MASPRIRPAEQYGDVALSIQASETHYSTPRVSGLSIEQYTHVEIGVLGPKTKSVSLIRSTIKSNLCRPSEIGIDGFDHLFEDGDFPVAGYVPIEEAEKLREALRKRAEEVAAK